MGLKTLWAVCLFFASFMAKGDFQKQASMSYEEEKVAAKRLVSAMERDYQFKGQDNNYIAFEVISLADFLAWQSPYSLKQIKTPRELIKPLTRCVFQSEGAYGLHISDESSLNYATKWAYDMEIHLRVLDVYLVEGKLIATEIAAAPCTLAIILSTGNVLLMQTEGSD